MKEIQPVSISAATDTPNISRLIYTIRNQQVMLASDLAMLYQVETRVLNQAVKRNQKRFPERYCFQLTKEEAENLTSQIVMSSSSHGGRRIPPYAFTEQGIAMLSAVLRSDVAIDVSIRIMDAFVEMRHFISGNAHLFERIERVELKQLTYQKEADEKFEQIFDFIHTHTESSQKIFFNGQIYDAFSLLAGLIQKATKDIILIDGYVDIGTLNLLAKKQANGTKKMRQDGGSELYPCFLKDERYFFLHQCHLADASYNARISARVKPLDFSITSTGTFSVSRDRAISIFPSRCPSRRPSARPSSRPSFNFFSPNFSISSHMVFTPSASALK